MSQEAFVSYDRHTGRPRGFGFVVFADPVVADRVVSLKHTIDRREVEAKRALPKDESPLSKEQAAVATGVRTKKVFIGGLAPTVDEPTLKTYFEEYGTIEDVVVMYDHEKGRPRGFGFVTYQCEESVDRLFNAGAIHILHEKQIEAKRAVPRDSMPPSPRGSFGARSQPMSPSSSTVRQSWPSSSSYPQQGSPFLARTSSGFARLSNSTFSSLAGITGIPSGIAPDALSPPGGVVAPQPPPLHQGVGSLLTSHPLLSMKSMDDGAEYGLQVATAQLLGEAPTFHSHPLNGKFVRMTDYGQQATFDSLSEALRTVSQNPVTPNHAQAPHPIWS